MELTEKENQGMCKIVRSRYGWLPVTENGCGFSVDADTAQCLVKKKLLEYTYLGTTKFVRLTTNAIGLWVVPNESN